MNRPSQKPPGRSSFDWPVPPMLLLALAVSVVLIITAGLFSRYSDIGSLEKITLAHGLGYFLLAAIFLGAATVVLIKLLRRLFGVKRSSILDRIDERARDD